MPNELEIKLLGAGDETALEFVAPEVFDIRLIWQRQRHF